MRNLINESERLLINDVTRNAAKLLLIQGMSIANITEEYKKVNDLISYEKFIVYVKKGLLILINV